MIIYWFIKAASVMKACILYTWKIKTCESISLAIFTFTRYSSEATETDTALPWLGWLGKTRSSVRTLQALAIECLFWNIFNVDGALVVDEVSGELFVRCVVKITPSSSVIVIYTKAIRTTLTCKHTSLKTFSCLSLLQMTQQRIAKYGSGSFTTLYAHAPGNRHDVQNQ